MITGATERSVIKSGGFTGFSLTIIDGSEEITVASDAQGVAIVRPKIDPNSSFHGFKIKSNQAVKLNFRYECLYQRTSDARYVWCAHVEDGEFCPPDASSGSSHHVRRIRIILDGNDKALYELEVVAKSNHFNNSENTSSIGKGSDVTVGLPEDGQPGWISELRIQIRPKMS